MVRTLTTTALVKEEVLQIERTQNTRVWSPRRSKLAAAITNGYKQPDFKNKTILYLGASHGYTPSFLSDLVEKKGMIFCVEKSKTAMQKLLKVCQSRENMSPILADANKPESYTDLLPESVDVLYQDLAQKNQAQIFIKNLTFLKKGGIGFFAVKAKTIDTTAPTEQTVQEAKKEVSAHVEILETINLEPYEHDHAMLIVRKA